MTKRKTSNWLKRIARRIAKRYKRESIYEDYTRRPNWPSVAFWSGLYSR
ncbi:MAG: hypothetical protein ACXAEE_03685 [Candidatus Thorarchaeota archaeon]